MIGATLFVVLLGAAIGVAANKYNKPKSVLHIVTLLYKDGTTDEQKKKYSMASNAWRRRSPASALCG
ncbi:MAG: hypothetical protein QM757_19390 [Paludibaculum sp.]